MWHSINICLMYSIVVLSGKENIFYTIIFQRFCRMHRPSSMGKEFLKWRKCQRFSSKSMHLKSIKIIFFFLPTDRIRTLYHTIGYCAFLNKVSDPDSGEGGGWDLTGKGKSVEEKKENRILPFIHISPWQSQQITCIDCSRLFSFLSLKLYQTKEKILILPPLKAKAVFIYLWIYFFLFFS